MAAACRACRVVHPVISAGLAAILASRRAQGRWQPEARPGGRAEAGPWSPRHPPIAVPSRSPGATYRRPRGGELGAVRPPTLSACHRQDQQYRSPVTASKESIQMSAQHESPAVAIARAHVEAQSNHDFDAARRGLAPDVQVTSTTTQPIMKDV